MTRSGEYFFIRFFSRPYKFCQKIISRAYENKFFLSSSNVICWTVNSEFWTEAALETSNEMWSYWPPASYQNHDRVCIHNIKFRCRYEIKKKILRNSTECFRSKNSSVLEPLGDIEICTYIRVRTLVCPRTGKGDKFMTPFVYHETANCKKKEASWCYRQSWYTYAFNKKKFIYLHFLILVRHKDFIWNLFLTMFHK